MSVQIKRACEDRLSTSFMQSVETVTGLWAWLVSIRRMGTEGKMIIRYGLEAGESLGG